MNILYLINKYLELLETRFLQANFKLLKIIRLSLNLQYAK